MSLITKNYTFSAGGTIIAAEHNSNFDTVYALVNGNIDASNIKSNASIVDTQLTQITTASKVSGASLTSLSSIPSGAGAIPDANLGNALLALPAGSVVQVVNSKTASVITCTTALPNDDTIPQNTEGDQVLTCTITPKSSTNKLQFLIQMTGDNSTSDYPGVALFQDENANALAAQWTYANAVTTQLNLNHFMDAGTTSETTFKVRVGASAGNVNINSRGGRIFGGVSYASITIMEIKA